MPFVIRLYSAMYARIDKSTLIYVSIHIDRLIVSSCNIPATAVRTPRKIIPSHNPDSLLDKCGLRANSGHCLHV